MYDYTSILIDINLNYYVNSCHISYLISLVRYYLWLLAIYNLHVTKRVVTNQSKCIG